MHRMCAVMACVIVLSATNGSAAETNRAPEKDRADVRPHVLLQVRDCSLPVCEEQAVYLRADNKLMFINIPKDRGPYLMLGEFKKSWLEARPGAFDTVSMLVSALSKALPPAATCDKVGPERISATGTLVSDGVSLQFQFSDACAGQANGSMSYELVREIRKAMTLGVQPLFKG